MSLFESKLSLPLLHRGKVRDVYEIDASHILIVASDRISAFDVIMPTPIPGKGEILTAISNFWFDRFKNSVPNHMADLSLSEALPDEKERALIEKRAVVARKLKALPTEAIVRGYLIGSGWKDYQHTGAVCGIKLRSGLAIADRLPEPIYTPSTKAPAGSHDENVDFEQTMHVLGPDKAERVRALSLELYERAASYALERGIIIADTKFEFGLDEAGEVRLMDEVLTPDSSRFWPQEDYASGSNPPSFDKQYLRDYLETLPWNKKAPGPELPAEVVRRTQKKYTEALRRLTGTTEP
jgi:phosphoribosylaminoimidazole-succinocarboxamide synthase